ncbi:hypothetical protein [Coraliomargarita akajimensis]|uniref:hypothetical protein n=1 Tax=Coraliomargarita akajimensis TaxID=395922 RepID=UPI0002D886D7|nr:hypothetical protein [Coraliomargarita akajimensis]
MTTDYTEYTETGLGVKTLLALIVPESVYSVSSVVESALRIACGGQLIPELPGK